MNILNLKFLKLSVKRCIASALIVGLSAQGSFAAFKDDGWGARPSGMASAFTAIADDSNAPLVNAAGIAQQDKMEVNLSYARLFTGINLQGHKIHNSYAAFTMPTVKYGAFGIVWANQTTTSLYREDTFALNYAININDYVHSLPFEILVGANLKYLLNSYTLDARSSQDIVFQNGSDRKVFAFDIGTILNYERNSFGLSARNVNSPDVGLVVSDNVPREFSVGISRYYYRFWFTDELVPTIDVSYRDEVDPDVRIKAGAEAWLLNHHFAIRGGTNHFRNVTLGMGYRAPDVFKIMEIQLDYAFILPTTVEGTSGTHRVTFVSLFKGSSTRAALRAQQYELRKQRIDLQWEIYIRAVNAGASLQERLTILKKFVKRYLYADVDISYAIAELKDVSRQLGVPVPPLLRNR